MRTSVYKYFDQIGVLLYVGITGRGIARNVEHDKSKPWWRYVAHQEVDHYETRGEAEVQERRLITARRPPFNTQHNPDHAAARLIYELYEATPRRDPRLLARQLNLRLPLVAHDGGFRTHLEHAAVAIRLDQYQGVKVCDATGVRVGQLTDLRLVGPLAVLAADLRRGIEWTSAEARLKHVPRKGGSVGFGLRHIRLIT